MSVDKERLMDFAEKFIEQSTFVSSRRLATAFEGTVMREQPTKSLVYQFAQVLRKLIEKGLIEKYNNRQYRVIK